MAQQIIPKAALEYWKNKKPRGAWSYLDVWKSEHALAFTVAKAMQGDVLSDLQKSVGKAIAEGKSFEKFRKELEPLLVEKGWWGKKKYWNPETGKEELAQLGSRRRLKTIFETNTRQAYNAGHYQQGMRSSSHEYILYELGPSRQHRAEHVRWEGLCLPKDDPIWQIIAPMNGWGCKCQIRFVTKAKYEKLLEEGMPKAKFDKDGKRAGTEYVALKTQRPKLGYRNWLNKRTGKVERVPEGISPGFDWAPGGYGRSAKLAESLIEKAKRSGLSQSEGWIARYFKDPIVRADYHGFVEKALRDQILDRRFSAVGLLPDWALAEFAQRGGKKKNHGKTGLLLMDAKLLQAKNTKHELAPGSRGLSDEEWLDLPNWLQNYDKVTWDTKYNSMMIWKDTEDGWGAVAISLSEKDKVEGIRGKVDHIRTAYAYTEKSWSEVMRIRQNRDQLIKEK